MTRLIDALTDKDREYFDKVVNLAPIFNESLNQIREEKRFTTNCHSTVRAIGFFVPGLKVRDGFYLSLTLNLHGAGGSIKQVCEIRHSWLVTPNDAVIDPYPPSFLAWSPALMPSIEKSEESLAGLYVVDHRAYPIAQRKTVLRRAKILQQYMKACMDKKDAS